MTTKNHYYSSLQERETTITGAGKPNIYSRLAEGGLIGLVIFVISCGLISAFTSNLGPFIFLGYSVVGFFVIGIACLPVLLLIFVISKVFGKELVYGRQPETEGY